MGIKQHFEKAKKKLESIDWKKLIGTKAFITVGCVMLICAAVLVSTLVGTSPDTPTDEGNRVLGNTLLADSSSAEENDAGADVESGENINASPETAEDFFAMAIINRTQVRDSALEVLREIAESPDTLPDAKEDALASIADIADDMSAEANIETLVKAKGIGNCVAVISGDSCSVIVNQNGLLPDELTQITDIVFEQTGIPVTNITVVEARK
ncbi:MAG: SpoIIIAH-like family protein [Clostridia bacterium]|nr:SpoIIIAH-like family protein [Clostridia bacterium]